MSESLYWYTMAIEDGDKHHAYGVHFPDLPGCFSAGDTLQDAISNARDAVLLFIQHRLARGEPLPEAQPLEHWKRLQKYSGPRWTWVPSFVDVEELSGPPARVNIMIPRVDLARIDAAANQAGESRSAFMVGAALARAPSSRRQTRPRAAAKKRG